MEIKEILGGMSINALESLRGNRLHLRAAALTQGELDVLRVRGARGQQSDGHSPKHTTPVIDIRDGGTNHRAGGDMHVYGTPGNDLGAFMNGSRIAVSRHDSWPGRELATSPPRHVDKVPNIAYSGW